MENKTKNGSSRKQITFDLSQKDLAINYPRPKITINPKFYKKAYRDISQLMKMNGFEHRQYSVYTSKNSLTTYGIVDLMEKLSQKLPWLYLCINEIDVTDIGEQHSVKGILREFINQEEILIIKEEIPKEEK